MVGVDACHLGTDIFLTVADGDRGAILCPHLINDALELRIGGGDVTRLQTDAAPLLQTLIGFRGTPSEDHHGVGQEAFRLVQLRVNQSVARTQQYDNHEDAPRHSESCERRAQLVATGRLPYLIQ